MKSIHLAFLCFFICACAKNEKAIVQSDFPSEVKIIDLLADTTIAQIQPNEVISIQVEQPMQALLKSDSSSYLIVLRSGKSLNILEKNGGLKTENKEDSVLNYLASGTNEFIGKNSGQIFNNPIHADITILLEDFKKERAHMIKSTSSLTSAEIEYLLYQNEARIYSFLFYLGRNSLDIAYDDEYYSFADTIELSTEFYHSLPQNTLYKLELEYLTSNDSINSISDFTSFIEPNLSSQKLSDFYKVIYLRELIESPSYWKRHQNIFNSTALSKVLNKEKGNPYFPLLERSSNGYFNTRKGQKAPLFTAETKTGQEVQLSSFKNKLIFIDVWASWCGPCIDQRPEVEKLARQLDPTEVVFLAISIDSDKVKWTRALDKLSGDFPGSDLWIDETNHDDFEEDYSVTFLPRYILIDRNGDFINSSLESPSQKVKELITTHL